MRPKSTHGCSEAPTQRSWQRAAAALIVGLLAFAALPKPAAAVVVTIDTTSLATASGRFEFNLFDGDATANGSVTISAITTDGGAPVADCSFGCSGGPPFVVDDGLGFGQLLLDLTLGSYIAFNLEWTTNSTGAAPDRMVLSLLDPGTSFTLVDTDLDLPVSDPVGYNDALLVVDLVAGTAPLVAGLTDPRVPVRVPEPGPLALALIGMSMLACPAGFGRRARLRLDRGRSKNPS